MNNLTLDKTRESEWLDKFNQQQDKYKLTLK